MNLPAGLADPFVVCLRIGKAFIILFAGSYGSTVAVGFYKNENSL